jgi:fucose permease
VQFAHYLGYFIMAMPAGWLASKLGYKGGIISGLLIVALGGFWFVPATHLAQSESVSPTVAFVGFLAGVCTIAAGLTFLETVANPYTTVLGPKQYAATRINLAQSCNGIGWISGPILGSLFFYSKDASGQSTGSETLYIPYVAVACVVIVLAVIFYFARVPDIKAEDDYQIEDKNAASGAPSGADRKLSRWQIYALLLANATALIVVFGMIFYLILTIPAIAKNLVGFATTIPHPDGMRVTPGSAPLLVTYAGVILLTVFAVLAVIPFAAKVTHHSMWSHPHFSASVVVQFLYVAAQAGIFSFLVNYMTEDAPAITPGTCKQFHSVVGSLPVPKSWLKEMNGWVDLKTKMVREEITDLPAFVDKLNDRANPVSVFVTNELSDESKQALDDYKASTSYAKPLENALIQDLNKIVRRVPVKVKPGVKMTERQEMKAKKNPPLYDAKRFAGVKLSESAQQLLKEENADQARLNRLLLADAYPGVLAFNDGVFGISDSGAAILFSFGFICFLVGRFSGSAMLKKFSAHKMLGLYGLLNVLACLLIFFKLGWLSVACVFLSFFFMSIMFPTIFALGIFGLGVKAKKASAFLVMAVTGGAILPKLMGSVADQYDMSRGFIVPLACFAIICLYGFGWPLLSGSDSLHGASATSGH